MNFTGKNCVMYTYLNNTDEGPFQDSDVLGLDTVECIQVVLDEAIKIGDIEYVTYIELDYEEH